MFFSIAALDCAKVTAENSEFLRIPPKLNDRGNICNEEQTISATNSDVTVTGCYIHHSVAEEENTLSNLLSYNLKTNFAILYIVAEWWDFMNGIQFMI